MKSSSNQAVVFSDNDLIYKLLSGEIEADLLSTLSLGEHSTAHRDRYKLLIIDHASYILINNHRLDKPFLAIDLFKVIQIYNSQRRENNYKIGDYDFFPHLNLVSKDEEIIKFTEKETQILHYLLEVSDFVGKDELLNKVWGYNNNVETKTLETHIYKMKQKFTLLKELLRREKSDYILDKS